MAASDEDSTAVGAVKTEIECVDIKLKDFFHKSTALVSKVQITATLLTVRLAT